MEGFYDFLTVLASSCWSSVTPLFPFLKAAQGTQQPSRGRKSRQEQLMVSLMTLMTS